MTSDYKYRAQMRAEEAAADEFGEDVDFFALPEAKRHALYREGLEVVVEEMEARAEWERDRCGP